MVIGNDQETDVEKYLKTYTYLRQWVNECAACHHKGYRPDMPEPRADYTVFTAAKLRRLPDELELDEQGLCEQCSAAARLYDAVEHRFSSPSSSFSDNILQN